MRSIPDRERQSGRPGRTPQFVGGLYIVTLRGDGLMPVTQDKRYVEVCARVNSANLKVGKAEDFRRRERDYIDDFGEGNLVFLPILNTEDIAAAEGVALRALLPHRKRSPKGGRMEWLEGIDQAGVLAVIFAALDAAGINYERLT